MSVYNNQTYLTGTNYLEDIDRLSHIENNSKIMTQEQYNLAHYKKNNPGFHFITDFALGCIGYTLSIYASQFLSNIQKEFSLIDMALISSISVIGIRLINGYMIVKAYRKLNSSLNTDYRNMKKVMINEFRSAVRSGDNKRLSNIKSMVSRLGSKLEEIEKRLKEETHRLTHEGIASNIKILQKGVYKVLGKQI